MDRRFIFYIGYAWRISCYLDNIEVIGYLLNVIYILAISPGEKSVCRMDNRRITSLFEALYPHGESPARPTQFNPGTYNEEIQINFDLVTTSTGALCELIERTVQEQVQALTVRTQLEEAGERIHKQEIILNDLERHLCLQ